VEIEGNQGGRRSKKKLKHKKRGSKGGKKKTCSWGLRKGGNQGGDVDSKGDPEGTEKEDLEDRYKPAVWGGKNGEGRDPGSTKENREREPLRE